MKVFVNKNPKIYYVSLTGNNSNTGLSEAQAWRTITYAASLLSPVDPGDLVYVKGGNYGNENVVVEKNGLPGAPIIFEGYKTVPGDKPALLVNNGNPYAAYTVTEMPTLTGSSRTTGTAFDLENKQYIIFRNFQVQNYQRAFLLGFNAPVNYDKVSGCQFYNCNAMTLGDLSDDYSGFGFTAGNFADTTTNHIRAHNNLFQYCLVTNPGAEGILVCGDYNTVIGCKVYCNESSNILDYFINVCGSFNTLYFCEVEGTTGDFGGAHGIGFKSNAEQVIDLGRPMPPVNPMYNRAYDCISRNIGEGFFVRHRGCQYNSFTRCYAYGTHTGTGGSSGRGACIVIRDGASYNTFDSCYGEGLESAIMFQDTTEDGDAGNTPGHTGNFNFITNCVFYNTYYGMNFNAYDTPSDAGINTIANCTFFRSRYLFGAYRSCTQMIYANNIFYGNATIGSGGTFKTDGGSGFAAGIVSSQFTNCCFYDIDGGMPGGFVGTNGNIGTDPLFISLGALGGAAPNLNLQSTSPSRNAGTTLNYVKNDFKGLLRPFSTAYSIGAYER